MHIVVIEDDEFVAKLMTRVLERNKHQIVHLADGTEASDYIAGSEPPELVVLDYMLPGKSGPELLQEIRARAGWDKVPVIVVSARSGDHDVAEMFEAGADDYMKKPFGIDQLEQRIEALLKGGGYR